jgi:ABC-2 type transport system permease protein
MTGLKGTWTVISHQLRNRWRGLLIWGVALGGLGALYVALFPSMGAILNDYLKDAPEYLQGFLGDLQGPITVGRWLDIELMNAIVPVSLPFLAIAIGARAVAGSEERKTLDLLLSNPLPRWRVIAGAAVTMAISLAGVLLVTWLITFLAVPIVGVELSPAHLAAGLAAMWPFCLLFGTFSLLISTLARRAMLATVVPAAVLVAMYVVDSLAKATKTMEPAGVFSLFHYLGRPLEGGFPWMAALLMLAGACVLAAGAVAAFARRDIYT